MDLKIKSNSLSLLLFYGFTLLFSYSIYAQETLYVAAQTTTSLNRLYLPLYDEFEVKTGIKVIRVRVDDIKEFDENKAWFIPNGEPIDVINGQITTRLYNYYKQGKIRSLNSFWDKNNLHDDFSHIEGGLTFEKQILALPYAISTWQIFYSKPVFTNGLMPPKTLDELKNVCQVLTQRGIVPFHIMDKTPWSQMAWFEYITLRTQGLDFYNNLTEGNIPYTDERVKKVMLNWKSLIDAKCFSDRYGTMNWQSAVPYMLRGLVAMIFNGPGVIGKLEFSGHKQTIDFFTFPNINDTPRYETAPINAFHASKLSKKTAAIEKFLLFMAQRKVQERLTHPFSSIPANNKSDEPPGFYGERVTEMIIKSAGTSTFFDRKVIPEFEIKSRPFFVDIVQDGNIEKFMKGMEDLRKIYYQKAAINAVVSG